jgi:hypothetical protein
MILLGAVVAGLFGSRAGAETDEEAAIRGIRKAVSEIVAHSPWAPFDGPPSIRQLVMTDQQLLDRTREEYGRLFEFGAKYPVAVFGELIVSQLRKPLVAWTPALYAGAWYVRQDSRSCGAALARLYETGSCSKEYDSEIERLIKETSRFATDYARSRREHVRAFAGRILSWSPHLVRNDASVVRTAKSQLAGWGDEAEIAGDILVSAESTTAIESLTSMYEERKLPRTEKHLRLLTFNFRSDAGVDNWKTWWIAHRDRSFGDLLQQEMASSLSPPQRPVEYLDERRVLRRWVIVTGIDPDLEYTIDGDGEPVLRFSDARKSRKQTSKDAFVRLRELWSLLKMGERRRPDWIRFGVHNSFVVLGTKEADIGERKTAVFVITEYVNSRALRGLSCMPISEWSEPAPDPAACAKAVRWWARGPSLKWDEERLEFVDQAVEDRR